MNRVFESLKLSIFRTLPQVERAARSGPAMSATLTLIVVCLTLSTVLGALPLKTQDGDSAERAASQSIDGASFTVVVSPSKVFVGQMVTFYVNVSSTLPNETIHIRIVFDAYDVPYPTPNNESANATANITTPAHAVFTYTYNQPGNFTDVFGSHYYRVMTYANDSETSTPTSRQSRVFVNYNSAPTWIQQPQSTVTTIPGRTEIITASLQDVDNDTLTVDWDFGDGTTAQDTVTGTAVVAPLNRSHSWNPVIIPRDEEYYVVYWMNISVTDGFNPAMTFTSFVNVTISRNWEPIATLEAFPTYVEPMVPITFNASVRDPEGDPITWYFDWGDNTSTLIQTPQSAANVTVWNNQTHSFAWKEVPIGTRNSTQYNITMTVVDVLPTHNKTQSVQIFVRPNFEPGVTVNISYTPNTLEINATLGYLNVTFWIDVSDDEGDPITATWNMDDGSGPKINTTDAGPYETRTFRQWRNFTGPAHFNITVEVTDGRVGHTVLRWRNATVVSTNRAPELTLAPSWVYQFGNEALPNETLNISMKAKDAEHDALTIVWDFGDGSPLLVIHFNRTDYDKEGNITCNVTHSYSKVGTYQIKVWITDNQLGYGEHNLTQNATVTVRIPEKPIVMTWDWWDYTSLALFSMVPISFVIYGAWIIHKRRKMDKEGIDWNEYRVKKKSELEGGQ